MFEIVSITLTLWISDKREELNAISLYMEVTISYN